MGCFPFNLLSMKVNFRYSGQIYCTNPSEWRFRVLEQGVSRADFRKFYICVWLLWRCRWDPRSEMATLLQFPGARTLSTSLFRWAAECSLDLVGFSIADLWLCDDIRNNHLFEIVTSRESLAIRIRRNERWIKMSVDEGSFVRINRVVRDLFRECTRTRASSIFEQKDDRFFDSFYYVRVRRRSKRKKKIDSRSTSKRRVSFRWFTFAGIRSLSILYKRHRKYWNTVSFRVKHVSAVRKKA